MSISDTIVVHPYLARGAKHHIPIIYGAWNPVPEALNRVILVRHTLLYTLELPRLSLLKVSVRIRRRHRREQFITRTKAQVNSRTQELP